LPLRIDEEPEQRAIGSALRHAVQIEPRFGIGTPARKWASAWPPMSGAGRSL
jgi:hypothetical protein